MYVVIKHVVDMVPVSAIALTKDEAIEKSASFISDVSHAEGKPHPDSLPTASGEPKQGFWDSGSFVVAHRHSVQL